MNLKLWCVTENLSTKCDSEIMMDENYSLTWELEFCLYVIKTTRMMHVPESMMCHTVLHKDIWRLPWAFCLVGSALMLCFRPEIHTGEHLHITEAWSLSKKEKILYCFIYLTRSLYHPFSLRIFLTISQPSSVYISISAFLRPFLPTTTTAATTNTTVRSAKMQYTRTVYALKRRSHGPISHHDQCHGIQVSGTINAATKTRTLS